RRGTRDSPPPPAPPDHGTAPLPARCPGAGVRTESATRCERSPESGKVRVECDAAHATPPVNQPPPRAGPPRGKPRASTAGAQPRPLSSTRPPQPPTARPAYAAGERPASPAPQVGVSSTPAPAPPPAARSARVVAS